MYAPGAPVIWVYRNPRTYPSVERIPATVIRQTTRKVTIDAQYPDGVKRVSVDPDNLEAPAHG